MMTEISDLNLISKTVIRLTECELDVISEAVPGF